MYYVVAPVTLYSEQFYRIEFRQAQAKVDKHGESSQILLSERTVRAALGHCSGKV